MDKGRQPTDRLRRDEAQAAMDDEPRTGAARPDTLRPGPLEGRTREGERGPGEEKDDDRSIATEEDDEELEIDDDDEDLDDEDAEDEGRPARPVK
ncbi:MAG TPA: hypothetical protein VJU81_22330 [Methylomirabilota bacterium]|nr:hypothetical protein [Methylomirabilota bacterium]